jgi:hypothetical protein
LIFLNHISGINYEPKGGGLSKKMKKVCKGRRNKTKQKT